MKVFKSEYVIYFEDISPSGMVHIEKIAEWMSMGRERFFRSTCPEHLKFAKSGVNMFTIYMTIFELKSSQWADVIEARISFSRIKKISFEIHFDFYNKRERKVIAKGIQKVAFVKEGLESFAPVPEDINSSIKLYIKG